MKNLLLFLFCLVAKISLAQVVVDPNVVKLYNNVFKKLSVENQHFTLQKTSGQTPFSGYAIFTIDKTDTLNKKDKIRHSGYVHIKDIDSNKGTGRITYSDVVMDQNENINMPVFLEAALKGDTLILSPMLDFYPQIVHKVLKNKVTSSYGEYHKRDAVLRHILSQPKSEKISIPAQTPGFKLSTSNLKPGQVIYGEIEYFTDVYYVDDPNFTSTYIKKRLHGKYVFKATIR